MPFVHVSTTRDGTSQAQKRQLVREITDTLERVLGKQPDLTHTNRCAPARTLAEHPRCRTGHIPVRCSL
jgi:hypothetical protein